MAARCLLYYITDRVQFPGGEFARRRALVDKVAEAARAGVDYIQLREKDLSARDMEHLAREYALMIQGLRTENRELRARLLINSRTDVALAAGADGVHLRAGDISPRDVRRAISSAGHRPLTTDHFFIAVSCHSVSDVLHAESESADFAVFAPVFEKKAAHGTHPQGLASLAEACKATIPVLALGGITLENAQSCLDAGAAGVAGIRLFQADKISEVVRALRPL